MKPLLGWTRGLLRIVFGAVLCVLRGLAGFLLLLAGAWGVGAIHYSGFPIPVLRTALSITFAVWSLAAFGAVGHRWRTVGIYLLGVAVLLGVWNLKAPSASGDYPPETAQLATATFEGNKVTLRNVRNFAYRSTADFDTRWETRSYDLDRLRTVDFIVSHWAGEAIAHTMLSFVFEGGEYLAVSVEIRRRRDQEYSILAGIYRQFTLTYVWADERDVLRLRTNHRGEDVYVYPTVADPPGARAMLSAMLRRTNELAEHPAFYSTLGRNCTTTLVDHVNEIMPGAIPYSRKLLMNGLADSYAFELGWIATDKSFFETRAAALVNPRARAAGDAEDFSRRIRTHIPGR